MRITIGQAKPGDILIFKGEGQPFGILSKCLKFFEPTWDGWGWHMATLTQLRLDDGKWEYIEATDHGLDLNYGYLNGDNVRVYRWFNSPPMPDAIKVWVKNHLGLPYDVAIYFWTAASYIARHFWNRPVPYLLDNRYSCWEAVFKFCKDMGKPIPSKHDCPTLIDFLKTQGEA